MDEQMIEQGKLVVARAIARSHGLGDHMGDEHLKPWLRDGETAFRAAHSVIAVKVAELTEENVKLRMQLVASLAGTYNVAPHATTNMCGRLDDSGLLLASVKEMAASLHSIKPDAAALAPYPERRSE